MNQIKAELFVGRPPSAARRRLDAFFEQEPIMALHVELMTEDDSALVMERDVKVRFSSVEHGERGSRQFRVSWGPCEGGPYLAFEGTVEVMADEQPGGLRLILSGSYVPPAGIAGSAFDFIVGRRMARATARASLQRLRAAIVGADETDTGKALRSAAG